MTLRQLIEELQRDKTHLDTHIKNVAVNVHYTNQIEVCTGAPSEIKIYVVNPRGKPSKKGWQG